MADRAVTSILRDIDQVEKSKYLNEAQKAHAISMFKRELDNVLGQSSLPLEPGQGAAPAPRAGKGA